MREKEGQEVQKLIPWYRTRWFWGGSIVVLVVGSAFGFLPYMQTLTPEDSGL